jgi:SAM-dependent methyltransferase
MAHVQQNEYMSTVRSLFPSYFANGRVLEIGSMDLNGTVRSFFSGCDYVGLDVAPGPCVDVVCGGHDYDGASATFDVVLSCEAMEHNPHWEQTFSNMIRLCRPGGMVLFTCATDGRPEHGTKKSTPECSLASQSIGWDYYRNLKASDFSRSSNLDRIFSIYGFFCNYEHSDLYFLGLKADPSKRGSLSRGDAAAFTRLRRKYMMANIASLRPLTRMLLIKLLGDNGFDRARALYRRSLGKSAMQRAS